MSNIIYHTLGQVRIKHLRIAAAILGLGLAQLLEKRHFGVAEELDRQPHVRFGLDNCAVQGSHSVSWMDVGNWRVAEYMRLAKCR